MDDDDARSGVGAGGIPGFPAAPSTDPWRTIRAAAATASGRVLSTPALVYGVVLVAKSSGQYATLFDSTNSPQNLLGAIAAPANESRTFPQIPYARLSVRRGLYVSFSDPGTERVLMVGYR